MTTVGAMTDIELARRMHAEAASVALLLSGPGRSEPVGDDGTTVRIGPPLRSSLGFRATVSVVRDEHPISRGRLRVVVAPDRAAATDVEVALSVPDAMADDVRRASGRFLLRLARDAEQRASAA